MTGRTTVGLRCENGAHWTIFVGVMVRAFRPALVAARPLPRGTVLAATDIRIEEREVSTQRGATVPAEPAQVIGTTLRRALEPGEILASTALAPRRLVHRGERISIVAGEGSFRVRMAGEALADAAAGERVRVRNASSGRIVDATVTGAATVEVGL